MICASTILLAAIATIFSTPAAAGLVPIGRSSDSAPFAINSGTQGPNDVVWVHGQNQCNNVVIGPVGPNPCGRPFGLNGQSGFTLEGCGTDSLWIDQNGAFYAQCVSFSEPEKCNVVTAWHCV
ncbi:hypothetical protein B0H14DRAFT_2364368 [Mycena olivaceomarginata]|nr:hypothetical protein B0H14DRAFT_2415869 [Mycena olivaceomarginata]KAJ7833239.1 hypothetical protein B0H14DRAFT_2364368 [Mycena olivaceomarginata]